MMKNFFNVDTKTTILFNFWKTETGKELFISCLLVMLISLSYEAIKGLRVYLIHKKVTKTPPNETTKLNQKEGESNQHQSQDSLKHLLQTLLYWVQIWLGICSMLVYMTFNVYLCLAISLGNVLGYFIIAWINEKYVSKDFGDNKCC